MLHRLHVVIGDETPDEDGNVRWTVSDENGNRTDQPIVYLPAQGSTVEKVAFIISKATDCPEFHKDSEDFTKTGAVFGPIVSLWHFNEGAGDPAMSLCLQQFLSSYDKDKHYGLKKPSTKTVLTANMLNGLLQGSKDMTECRRPDCEKSPADFMDTCSLETPLCFMFLLKNLGFDSDAFQDNAPLGRFQLILQAQPQVNRDIDLQRLRNPQGDKKGFCDTFTTDSTANYCTKISTLSFHSTLYSNKSDAPSADSAQLYPMIRSGESSYGLSDTNKKYIASESSTAHISEENLAALFYVLSGQNFSECYEFEEADGQRKLSCNVVKLLMISRIIHVIREPPCNSLNKVDGWLHLFARLCKLWQLRLPAATLMQSPQSSRRGSPALAPLGSPGFIFHSNYPHELYWIAPSCLEELVVRSEFMLLGLTSVRTATHDGQARENSFGWNCLNIIPVPHPIKSFFRLPLGAKLRQATANTEEKKKLNDKIFLIGGTSVNVSLSLIRTNNQAVFKHETDRALLFQVHDKLLEISENATDKSLVDVLIEIATELIKMDKKLCLPWVKVRNSDPMFREKPLLKWLSAKKVRIYESIQNRAKKGTVVAMTLMNDTRNVIASDFKPILNNMESEFLKLKNKDNFQTFDPKPPNPEAESNDALKKANESYTAVCAEAGSKPDWGTEENHYHPFKTGCQKYHQCHMRAYLPTEGARVCKLKENTMVLAVNPNYASKETFPAMICKKLRPHKLRPLYSIILTMTQFCLTESHLRQFIAIVRNNGLKGCNKSFLLDKVDGARQGRVVSLRNSRQLKVDHRNFRQNN